MYGPPKLLLFLCVQTDYKSFFKNLYNENKA